MKNSSFKSNENIHKHEERPYGTISATELSSVALTKRTMRARQIYRVESQANVYNIEHKLQNVLIGLEWVFHVVFCIAYSVINLLKCKL